jgi:hypothetical protein
MARSTGREGCASWAEMHELSVTAVKKFEDV